MGNAFCLGALTAAAFYGLSLLPSDAALAAGACALTIGGGIVWLWKTCK